ncbi:MAG TPA: galactose-1-phosphate uridylyltransferase [Ruminococcaceae bacterium]|nr:galactose-1-phosphate uridylyltransferase [Oscillospiraceae bacterium]
MAEMRWHPLIKDWVMIASHRQGRPQMPKDWCPFCPGSGRVPEDYDVLEYDNDFPALSQNPPRPDDVATDFFKVRPAYGKCEVILYSPKHTVTLPELSVPHIEKLVNLWIERFEAMRQDEKIKYIFIFENRGEAVGVTMPHPHGQIYGYPEIPKKLQLELQSSGEYYEEHKKCLFCDMIKAERNFEKRIIFENNSFMVFLPFFTEYPYGVYIISKRHLTYINQFTAEEKTDFADVLQKTTGMLDSLFGYKFPYMMCMHNGPVNSGDCSDYFHFHVEFFPPMRSENQQKFNASSETGVWAHCNPTAPEDKAVELKEALKRFIVADDKRS